MYAIPVHVYSEYLGSTIELEHYSILDGSTEWGGGGGGGGGGRA